MRRILILERVDFITKYNFIQTFYKELKLCVIQKQVPLPLPCVNFAQITTLSLTDQQIKLLATRYFNKGSALT